MQTNTEKTGQSPLNHAWLTDYLGRVALGAPQQVRNMVTYPLFVPDSAGLEYLTLTEALPRGLVVVSEINEGGSVPNLKVENQADTAVLLFDGEELVGCKQNRILNTSILLKAKSQAVVPVSCTEAGRWSRVSPKFKHSGHISPHKLRSMKAQAVAESLKAAKGHSSDQGAVWHEVGEMAACYSVQSPTSAMFDVYQAKTGELGEFVEAIKPLPDQKGLLVLINGEVAGLDLLSLSRAYQALHPMLVKGYGLDALRREEALPAEAPGENAAAFLERSRTCSERVYETVGWGADHRLEGPMIAGSALVAEGQVIHLNLYRN